MFKNQQKENRFLLILMIFRLTQQQRPTDIQSNSGHSISKQTSIWLVVLYHFDQLRVFPGVLRRNPFLSRTYQC